MPNKRQKPTVDQELYLVGRAYHGSPDKCKCHVSKVGRKYFNVETTPERIYTDARFFNDTWKEDCRSNYPISLYESKQEYDDMCEHIELAGFMRQAFSYGSKFSLDQLRRIKAIIEENKEQHGAYKRE